MTLYWGSTFENGQKRRKVDVLGAGCVNKRCCIRDTRHRIKFSEHYDVPFFCYLGFKVADVFPSYYSIYTYGYGVPSFRTMLLAGGPWEDVHDPNR